MAAPSSHMWYVRAAGGVWGPYPEARLRDFIAEGRVTAATLVSPWDAGPFAPAASNAEFAGLLSGGRRQPPSSASQPLRLASQPPAPAPGPAAPQAVETGPIRAVLIWARVSEPAVAAFHADLAALGSGMTLQPGLWLVQARMGSAALRNRLSRRLGPSDALLVVEAPLEHAAWFNLDAGRDRELRRLWTASGAA